ncbi:hypothetical protein G6F32_016499 [Rhizopus arrhizus]|nr:hypothetical protein G6F32_016499 [Rhizopus arrhizus]
MPIPASCCARSRASRHCRCRSWSPERPPGVSGGQASTDQHLSLRPISLPRREASSHFGAATGAGAAAAARAFCSCWIFARICGIAAIAAFSPSRIAVPRWLKSAAPMSSTFGRITMSARASSCSPRR